MRLVTVSLMTILLSACGSGGGSAPQTGTDTTPPAPVQRTVQIKGGAGFYCYLKAVGGVLFCWGNNVPAGIVSPVPTEYGQNITEYALFDSTVCIEDSNMLFTNIGGRGAGTFCAGYPNLNVGTFAGLNFIYGGPNVTWADVPTELALTRLPFVMAPYSLAYVLSLNTVADTQAQVTSVTVVCTVVGSDLVCPSFTITGGA